ncbi:MAG: class I SAM-dependent methyltransferase [Pseudomonadota bacterium]|nr:class I SAM-dependent methyltransferase [Pseudomonadota bacterium]
MKTNCDLCKSKEYRIIFKGPIRQGIFGQETTKDHEAVKCKDCGLVRLLKNPISIEYYQSQEYRNDYNESSNTSAYIKIHDHEQPPRLRKIGIENFRDKVILDHGCGGGAFLDLVKGVAKKTIGIEPFTDFHQSLQLRGHEVFNNSSLALKKYKGRIDTIISFGVIEHVEKPSMYLKDSLKLLCSGGNMFLETDNLDDILMKLKIPNFDRFFYRTAHLWYFNGKTLKRIVEKSGFEKTKITFRHDFDLSNFIFWAKENKPTGLEKTNLFNSEINSAWIKFLETQGYGGLVCASMQKK